MTKLKWVCPAVMLLCAGTAMAAESESGGSPSLIGPISAGAIPALTTLVVFVLLLIVLGKYAWGPIASGLKAREDKIRKDIADAEAARAKAEATLREYEQRLASAEEKIRELMQQATADAERAAENIRLRGREEAEEIKEKAQREIEASRDEALREIYRQAAELSTSIAEKIIRRNLNADDQRDLVERSLEQLETVKA